MFNIVLIFFGAGIGGVLRYLISNGIYTLLGRQFPYGTLIVNISGCFVMGLLFALLIERFNTSDSFFRSLLLIGLLGGYTTFSSFSLETLNLLESGALLNAVLNILLSVILCLGGTWLGILIGRQT